MQQVFKTEHLSPAIALVLFLSLTAGTNQEQEQQEELIDLLDDHGRPADSVLETLLSPDDFMYRRFVHQSRGDEAIYSLDLSLAASPPQAELHPERLPWPKIAGLELKAESRPLPLKKAVPNVTDEDLDAGFSVRWILRPLGQRFRPSPHFAVEVEGAEVLAADGKTPLFRWQSPPERPICPQSVEQGQPNCDLTGIGRDVRDLALSPDGSLLALALGGLRPRIEVYDIRKTPRLKWQALLSSNSGGAVEVAFSPDGTWVVTLTGQGKLHRFGAKSGGRHLAIPSSGSAAHTIPPGDIIAVAGEQGQVTFWYLKDGTIAWRLPPRGARGTVARLTSSADGLRFATLEYSEENVYVRVWEMHRRSILTQVAVAPYSISGIALDETGENIYLTHEQDGLLWSPVDKTAKPVPFGGEPGTRCRTQVRWLSPRGHVSCSVPSGELQFDSRGRLKNELKTGIESARWRLAASTDGTRLVAAGDGHLLLWWLDGREDSIGRVFQK